MVPEFRFDVEADQRASQQRESDRFQSSPDGNTDVMTTDNPLDRAMYQQAQESPIPEPDEASEIAAELAKLKHKLGEQGSQMGALKAQASQAEELRAEMARMRAENAQIKADAASRNNGSGDIDLFRNVPEGERFASPAERAMINQLAIAAAQTAHQQQQRQDMLEKTLLGLQAAQIRAATGLTQADEARMLAEKPYLQALNGTDRLQAMMDLAQNRQAPQRDADEMARSAARKNSHAETSNTVSSGDSTMTSAAEKLLRDMDSGRMDSKQMAAALRKIGIGRIDDYGRNY